MINNNASIVIKAIRDAAAAGKLIVNNHHVIVDGAAKDGGRDNRRGDAEFIIANATKVAYDRRNSSVIIIATVRGVEKCLTVADHRFKSGFYYAATIYPHDTGRWNRFAVAV
jgi:hypothetical protein